MTNWYERDGCQRIAYFVLIPLRVLLPSFVQNGYLYPDEFFQSSEIMAKDIFRINSTVTWEWNKEFPVRSPISAFLTSGIPFLILSLLSRFVDISPYLLLIFPRIHMTLVSFMSFDIPVYVISQRLNLKPFNCLLVLSTSYVTHVFATRPFSNTLETGIFGILLMLLINPGKKQFSVNDKDKYYEMPSYICILVGSLTSLGFFCRQTFLVFALVPYFGFLIDQVKRQQHYVVKTVAKLISMALGFLITSMVFILLDSWYFGYLEEGNFVLTPMNFIQYNAFQSHAHGYHPFFTHFLVNIPLLFGPMAFLLYFELGTLLWKFGGGSQNEQTGNHVSLKNFYKALLVLSIFLPIFILSLVPHQEPRFIMPVLVPMVLLFSSKIAGSKTSSSLLLSWSIWNVIGCIFFGILHQAGIVPSLYFLHKSINEKVHVLTESYCHHVVYFHTYMPPTHLLAWPNDVQINKHKLYIHDLGGSSREAFNQTMSKLKSDYCIEDKNMVRICTW